MADAPVVEKVAMQAKKIYTMEITVSNAISFLCERGRTNEERAECFGRIVEAADYPQAEDRCDRQGIGIDREWPSTKRIGTGGSEKH